ncbi:MAG TPA: glycoside hydrolase family 2 TIM barrel-domain containing protein [Bacteroidales bacterium]|nr:glycoside hydrolase family 2 TIM barrel-domain containing protein [Bacteroidales bacterium]
MKKLTLLLTFLFLYSGLFPQSSAWKIAGDRITTEWAPGVDPANPLPEYPRPQMVRSGWKTLNGLWDYAIAGQGDEPPARYDGKILVPFAVESALSGVGRQVGPDNVLWYRTGFTLPASFMGKNVLLHFEAVDWQADVMVNSQKVVSHSGGYDPFTADITRALRPGQNVIELKVTDPVDKGPQPRGKQVSRPGGIWYTSVTGIWRTVWLEAVPKTYITRYRQVPDIDNQMLNVNVDVEKAIHGDKIHLSAFDGNKEISEAEGDAGMDISLKVPGEKLWSPGDPFLYDLAIKVMRNGKIVDEVKGYFGMRKVSMAPDENGTLRIMLNNRFVFQFGPLDQGWWPDGLYTAPADEALAFDIMKTKEMGFNMIRKHVKVEPARWYYYCDRIGMLVWQDMPSGDLGGGKWVDRPGMEGDPDKTRSALSEKIYRSEWNSIIDYLYNFPSIIVWIPFNEGWGQFKTKEITEWTMRKDPSRLVNSASGGSYHDTGHILDLHNYPDPVMPRPELFGSKQALVLGEFGGLGLPVENHTWIGKGNWGYRSFADADTLFGSYKGYVGDLLPFIKRGLSAAIYTQTTDCEVEVNGLMTYDRKITKMDPEKLRKVASELYLKAGEVKMK